jgi:hypothetical protein
MFISNWTYSDSIVKTIREIGFVILIAPTVLKQCAPQKIRVSL